MAETGCGRVVEVGDWIFDSLNNVGGLVEVVGPRLQILSSGNRDPASSY
jgi:hypothetical protein